MEGQGGGGDKEKKGEKKGGGDGRSSEHMHLSTNSFRLCHCPRKLNW